MERTAEDEGQRELSSVSQRRFRPRFIIDIPKTVESLEKTNLMDRTQLIEVIGDDRHLSSHAWYFKCYERLDIHRTMVNDEIRTGSFLMAISRNNHILKNKIILDVGAGTGVLSIFAIKHGGAKRVIAVDASAITDSAKRLIRNCGLEKQITVVRDKMEDITELPNGITQVDVLISEWMGYGLFNESVLETVITARQRFLKDGGFIIPNTTTLKMVATSFSRKAQIDEFGVKAESLIAGLSHSRSEICDLSELLTLDSHFGINGQVQPSYILTDAVDLKVVDLYTIQLNEVEVDSTFSILCTDHGLLTSFVFYFDVLFDLPNSWRFSTGPEHRPTHWLQTVCSLSPGEELEVWKGNSICGRVRMRRIPALPRFWTVFIEYTVRWTKRSPVSRSKTFYLM